MTDKNKIRAEIERRKSLADKQKNNGYFSARSDAYAELLNFIDTLQEELKSKFKKGDTIYYDSFGEVESMTVANVVDNGDGIPMYEDAEGNSVFENELIEEPANEDRLRKASKEYLKLLSETPYNNTPVTNAQIIVKELVGYLDNPSKYDPDHVTELVNEDLEKEIDRWSKEQYYNDSEKRAFAVVARHFANWQKHQMMEDTIDAFIDKGSIKLRQWPLDEKYGRNRDKVKLIIIKED